MIKYGLHGLTELPFYEKNILFWTLSLKENCHDIHMEVYIAGIFFS